MSLHKFSGCENIPKSWFKTPEFKTLNSPENSKSKSNPFYGRNDTN